MGWWQRLIVERTPPQAALYAGVVARARAPHWYLDGAVPDTTDGRFDMVIAVLSAVLLRFEDGPAGAEPAARVTERFVEDMDGQLRESGIGDIVVGKHIGRLMAMLGGRLGAYRDGWTSGDIRPALTRNLYREAPVEPAALDHVAAALDAWRARLAAMSLAELAAGTLP